MGQVVSKFVVRLLIQRRPIAVITLHIIVTVSVKESYKILSNIWAKLQKLIVSYRGKLEEQKVLALFIQGI